MLQLHMKLPGMIKVTMAMIMIAVTDIAIHYCVFIDSNGNVKKCCSSAVHG